MMLGKPVIYLRPEWQESARKEVSDYIDKLSMVSVTSEMVRKGLLDSINDRGKREEIGCQSRDLAVKWHSKEAVQNRLMKFIELFFSKILKE